MSARTGREQVQQLPFAEGHLLDYLVGEREAANQPGQNANR
jgi:hypothetical protein